MYLLYSVNVYIFNVVIEIKFYSISILFYIYSINWIRDICKHVLGPIRVYIEHGESVL